MIQASKRTLRVIEFIVNSKRLDIYIYFLIFFVPILACFTIKGHYIYIGEVVAAMYGFGKSSFMIFDKVTIENMGVMLFMLFYIVKISSFGFKLSLLSYEIVTQGQNSKYVKTELFKGKMWMWFWIAVSFITIAINMYMGIWPLIYVAFFFLARSVKKLYHTYKKNIDYFKEEHMPVADVVSALENIGVLNDAEVKQSIAEFKEEITRNSEAIAGFSKSLKNG